MNQTKKIIRSVRCGIRKPKYGFIWNPYAKVQKGINKLAKAMVKIQKSVALDRR